MTVTVTNTDFNFLELDLQSLRPFTEVPNARHWKTAEKGAERVTVKQPEKQPKHTRKTAVGFGCCTVTLSAPFSAVFQCRAFGTSVLSRFWGRGCDEALFSEEKGFSVKRGEAIQWMRGLVRISTGKAIQWRGPGHSVNRRSLKTEKLLSSSPSRKSALICIFGQFVHIFGEFAHIFGEFVHISLGN